MTSLRSVVGRSMRRAYRDELDVNRAFGVSGGRCAFGHTHSPFLFEQRSNGTRRMSSHSSTPARWSSFCRTASNAAEPGSVGSLATATLAPPMRSPTPIIVVELFRLDYRSTDAGEDPKAGLPGCWRNDSRWTVKSKIRRCKGKGKRTFFAFGFFIRPLAVSIPQRMPRAARRQDPADDHAGEEHRRNENGDRLSPRTTPL
jgi:hypothetical protein